MDEDNVYDQISTSILLVQSLILTIIIIIIGYFIYTIYTNYNNLQNLDPTGTINGLYNTCAKCQVDCQINGICPQCG